MLLALTSSILVISFIIVVIRHDRRSLLIFSTCLSLFIFIFSILAYIAKKGGIGREISFIFYGTKEIRLWFQYLVLTLRQLGFITAIGRYTFPLLLLLTALDMVYFNFAVKIKKHILLMFIIPSICLICYIPQVFEVLVSGRDAMLHFLVNFSRVYVYGYALMTLICLICEYASITLPFFRRRFLSKTAILLSLEIIYTIYCLQDPAQIYLFYKNDYMFLLGLWYLSPAMSPMLYTLSIIGSVVFSIIGFIFLLRYMSINFDAQKEEIILKRDAKTASRGISMFFHGTKNELLAMGILLRRISKRYEDDEDVKRLSRLNGELNRRLQSLHRASRTDISVLSVASLEDVIQKAREKVISRYVASSFETSFRNGDIQILADVESLSEALGNILMNAVEAQMEAGRNTPVEIECAIEHLWVSVRISDAGKGLDRKQLRQIYQPFYSNKNSSQNWGMGMYYTRSVIKKHLGSIRYEQRKNGGSRFIVLLPKT